VERDAPFDGAPDFEARLAPELAAIPGFRAPTDEEVARSFDAYARGDFAALVDVWREVAAPTRALVDGALAAGWNRAHLLPRRVREQLFLATVRAALAAGHVLFGEQLKPETARAIRAQFAWLERRHEHVPPGFTPRFRFPSAFAAFVDGGTLEEAKARFQLCAALNEVQQHALTLDLGRRMALPELERHAARERAMAVAYFAHWAPPSTERLWRQCLWILDGLNAALLAQIGGARALSLAGGTLWSALTARDEWRSFVRGMDTPPSL
jgi:hypothetical protein